MLLAQDTRLEGHQAQLQAYRRMTPERRAEIALELSEAVREIAREGIRLRHPNYRPDEVARALVALLYGADIARRVWSDSEPLSP